MAKKKDSGPATLAEVGPPKRAKKDIQEEARRNAAAEADRVAAEWAGESKALNVLETVDLDPGTLVFRPDLQGRYKEVSNDKVLDLADSMRTQGQLSPIQVRKNVNGEYEVIYGNTRAKAGQYIQAGYTAYGEDGKTTFQVKPNTDFKIRAEVVECSDEEAFNRNVTENVHRNDCSPIDTMHNQARYREMGYNDVQIAKLYGYQSSASVMRYKRLANLIDPIKDRVHSGDLTLAAGFLLCDRTAEDQADIISRVDAAVLEKADKAGDSPEMREKKELLTDAGVGKIPTSIITKVIREFDDEKKKKEETNKPNTENKANTEAGASGTAASAPAQDKTAPALTLKEVKDGLRVLAQHEKTPPRVSQVANMFLEFVECRNGLEGLKILKDYLIKELAPETLEKTSETPENTSETAETV